MPPQKKDLTALRKLLRRGDYVAVAKSTGKTRQYVAMVAKATDGRTNEQVLAALVARAKANKRAATRTSRLLQTL